MSAGVKVPSNRLLVNTGNVPTKMALISVAAVVSLCLLQIQNTIQVQAGQAFISQPMKKVLKKLRIVVLG